MKTLALIAILFSGCASTSVFKNGQKILFTQANANSLEFRQGDTFLKIEGLNHSTPTRAGGSVIGTTGTALTGVAGAVVAGGIVP
jgi:hypothetical protein